MSQKKKIKFIAIYNSFSEKEKKEFGEYINCSFFNKGRDYIKFLNSLKEVNSDKLKLTFPIKDRTRWNRLSELSILAEKFLLLKRLESNDHLYNTLLLNEFNERKLNFLFPGVYSAAVLKSKKMPADVNKLKGLSELNKLCLTHLEIVNDNDGYLDLFYRNDKNFLAKLILEILDNLITSFKNKIAKPTIHDDLLEDIYGVINFNEILKKIKMVNPEYYPLVAFNYHIYRSFTEPDNPVHYQNVKKIFLVIHKKVSKDYLKSMYVNMINSLIISRNSDFANINEDLFLIIKSKLEQNLTDELKSNDFLDNYFRDFVFIACTVNKIKWAENFVKKYSVMLPVELKEPVIAISKAFINFKKGNYESCNRLLNNLTSRNPFIYIDKTKLTIISSYELNDIERCHLVLKSFNEYLRRPKNVQDKLVSYAKVFCRGVFLLLKLKEQPVKKNLLNLEYFLSKEKFESNQWISEKKDQIRISEK